MPRSGTSPPLGPLISLFIAQLIRFSKKRGDPQPPVELNQKRLYLSWKDEDEEQTGDACQRWIGSGPEGDQERRRLDIGIHVHLC